MFKIGEKVVCINDNAGWITGEKSLKEGNIYEVVRTNIADNGRFEIEIIYNGGFWDESRFRKLDYEFAENLLKEILESVNQKQIKTNTMKKLLLAIITLGYTSYEEISYSLFGGKSCMPNELKPMM